uniref:Uncharacterized protein n=1 Tax=Sinocyclocheilus rhinocerous TaxID=307959 RepID=A0A673N1H7_9TELE
YHPQSHLQHLDSSTPAFGHSIWYSCTRRIDHGHEANKTQVLSGEVHIFSIKCKTLRKLVIREAKVAETFKGKHRVVHISVIYYSLC